jgi:predicted transcriptional regulator YdeE
LTAVARAVIVAPEARMDIKVVGRGPILLVGMGFYGNPFSTASAWDVENEIGSLWKRFMGFLSAEPSAIADRADKGELWYELHVYAPETPKTGRYEVFVGVEVRSLASIPLPCASKVLPAADYAVLTARGEEISADWMGRLYSEIVPSLGREADERYCIDLYDARFKGMDRMMESEMDYYVPLLPSKEP